MMSREPLKRTSTLIDPASLHPRPGSQRMSTLVPQGNATNRLSRRNSKTLLNFDDEGPMHSPSSPSGLLGVDNQMSKSRSVFGVDMLWEREMAKLKDIEAKENAEVAERRKREEAEQMQSKKNKRGKGKDRAKADDGSPSISPVVETEQPRITAEPPQLPEVKRGITKGPPPPPGPDDSESEESDEEGETPGAAARNRKKTADAGGWGSSDEEDRGPRRTTGVGPRNPPPKSKSGLPAPQDSDSDEDVPLAATVQHARQRYTVARASAEDDSDEEKPLSTLVDKAKLGLPSIDFDKPPLPSSSKINDEDEDDKPLGLISSRASMLRSPSNAGPVEDDDVPLGLRPEQQRRTQYQMMAAQQQHMMMMQAQMTGSMYFGASPLGPAPPMMGSPFFGPPAPSPMMVMAPPQMPSPPPVHDAAKLNRVDKWRHDVAVEGEGS
jgi:hypothetical protein